MVCNRICICAMALLVASRAALAQDTGYSLRPNGHGLQVANGISPDGTTVVGATADGAAYWRGDSTVNLGIRASSARASSVGGQVIVGSFFTSLANRVLEVPFRWTIDGGPVLLGTLE